MCKRYKEINLKLCSAYISIQKILFPAAMKVKASTVDTAMPVDIKLKPDIL